MFTDQAQTCRELTRKAQKCCPCSTVDWTKNSGQYVPLDTPKPDAGKTRHGEAGHYFLLHPMNRADGMRRRFQARSLPSSQKLAPGLLAFFRVEP